MLLSEELALIAIDEGSGRPGLGIRAELNASLVVLTGTSPDPAALQAAARGESVGGTDRRTEPLLSMTGPAQLLEVVAPQRSGRREARQRIDHALDGPELAAIGKLVRTLIMENQSAAGAGVVTG